MSAITTVAPAPARPCENAAPSPEAPPVTTAMRPSRPKSCLQVSMWLSVPRGMVGEPFRVGRSRRRGSRPCGRAARASSDPSGRGRHAQCSGRRLKAIAARILPRWSKTGAATVATPGTTSSSLNRDAGRGSHQQLADRCLVGGRRLVHCSITVSAKYSSQKRARLEGEQRPRGGADVEWQGAAELDREHVRALTRQPLDEHRLVAAAHARGAPSPSSAARRRSSTGNGTVVARRSA